MTVWILTKEYNLYDQYGGYFVAAFSTEELARASVDHIGRNMPEDNLRAWEEEWYELEEVTLDEIPTQQG